MSDCIDVHYRTDGKLLILRRLKAKSKGNEHHVQGLLFANDYALNGRSEQEMQHSMDKLSPACNAFGMTISTTKIEAMYQPTPQESTLSQASLHGNGE